MLNEPLTIEREQPDPPKPAPSLAERVKDFGLMDRLIAPLAREAGVERPGRHQPSAHLRTVGRSVTALLRSPDPRKRRLAKKLVIGAAAVMAVVLVLGLTGLLGDGYEWVWSWWPGRPWTHAMRDHPWIYGLGAALVVGSTLGLTPRGRWGRAFVTQVIFFLGFLGGHVFW